MIFEYQKDDGQDVRRVPNRKKRQFVYNDFVVQKRKKIEEIGKIIVSRNLFFFFAFRRLNVKFIVNHQKKF